LLLAFQQEARDPLILELAGINRALSTALKFFAFSNLDTSATHRQRGKKELTNHSRYCNMPKLVLADWRFPRQ
jgi:hypothetical protein